MPLHTSILPDLDVADFAKLILHHSTDGILLTDSTGLVIAINKRFSTLFEIPASEVLGANVIELSRQGAWSPNLFQRVVKKKQTLSIIQTTRSGRSILATGTPIFDDTGTLLYVLFNDRDMSLQSVLETGSL